MGHEHHTHGHHHTDLSGKRLLYATILNFSITAVQIVGGFLANSLSLLSDALHNLGDASAILLAYIANKIGKKESTEAKTFGFKRIEILTALFNSIVLVTICIFLFVEAYERLINPEPIKGLLMFSVATFGLLANLAAIILLKKDKDKNINIKAAYLHLLGDTLSSVAVIIGGIFIYFYEIYWLDPLITVFIGVYIIKHTFGILKETIDILMQAAPKRINLKNIKADIEKINKISNIHHVHIWSLTDQQTYFESHIDLSEDIKISETKQISKEIEELLYHKYKINHITLQFEFNNCKDKNLIYKDRLKKI